MKQSRILVIAIIAVDLILAVVCMIAYFGEDRVRPEFRFQTDEYIYTEKDGESKLLENIMAYDDKDGDISERIVIEKITENRENSTIVVYYAVSDSAGNVAKISRVFVADFREQEVSEGEGVEALDGAPDDEGLTMEKISEMEGTGENDVSEEPVEGGGTEEDASDGTDGPEEETGTEETAEQAAVGQPEPVAEPEPSRENRSSYPILTLRTDEVTIAAGTSPPWTEIIETLRDDKDDYATLYYNLSVSRFNRNQAGDYPVSLYTEDSDGNRSDTVTVMIHVKSE